MAKVPPELQRRGRKIKPKFLPKEVLYRRFPSEYFANGELHYEALDMPDMSVNRTFGGRSRKKAQWLIDLAPKSRTWGVCGFTTEDIPEERYRNGVKYQIKPCHVPEETNYAHSEIRAYRNDDNHIPKGNPEIPLDWWMKWQVILCSKVFLEIVPEQTD